MRRVLLVVLCVFVAAGFTLSVCAVGDDVGKKAVSISLSNAVVEYTPAGYTPSADASEFGYEIRYEVKDDASGELVKLPIKEVGNYTVRAYINETSSHGSAEAVASLTVIPAKLRISVPNQSVAHTAMANPVRYTVYPSWAAGMLDVKISYRAIKSLGDEGTEVEVPVDMGSYLVYMEATPLNDKVECAGKYLIYTVGEAYGGAVDENTALLSVPASFKAQVESVDAEYTGEPVVPKCSLNAAGVESTLMYSRIYADGTSGTYTEEAPTDPGDYTAACFVLDTVVGSGKIVINKVVAKIEMEDRVYTYTPEGVEFAESTTVPEGIELKYKAYKYVNGQMGDSVDFPLVDCGTYLISASPADVYRYSYTDSICYSYITIKKVDPVIEAEAITAVEDGKPKNLSVNVLPEYADYSISYYKVEGDKAVPLTKAPAEAGGYFAVVSVKEDGRVNSSSAIFKIDIGLSAEEGNKLSGLAAKCICCVFCVCGVGVALYHIVLVKLNKRRKKV